MPLQMPDDANGAIEQGEDDTNKVPKRVNPRQSSGLVNEPATASTRRTTSKQQPIYNNPGISSSRVAASSQQQIPSGSRLTQGQRRNTKEVTAPAVSSDRLYVFLKLYIYDF